MHHNISKDGSIFHRYGWTHLVSFKNASRFNCARFSNDSEMASTYTFKDAKWLYS